MDLETNTEESYEELKGKSIFRKVLEASSQVYPLTATAVGTAGGFIGPAVEKVSELCVEKATGQLSNASFTIMPFQNEFFGVTIAVVSAITLRNVKRNTEAGTYDDFPLQDAIKELTRTDFNKSSQAIVPESKFGKILYGAWKLTTGYKPVSTIAASAGLTYTALVLRGGVNPDFSNANAVQLGIGGAAFLFFYYTIDSLQKHAKHFFHPNLLAENMKRFYISIGEKVDSNFGLSMLEKMVQKNPTAENIFQLAQKYYDVGRTKNAYELLANIDEIADSPISSQGFETIPYVRALLTESLLRIKEGSATPSDRFFPAIIYAKHEKIQKGQKMIQEAIKKDSSPEAPMLAGLYFNRFGPKEMETESWQEFWKRLNEQAVEVQNFGEGATSRVFTWDSDSISKRIAAKEDLKKNLEYQIWRTEKQAPFLDGLAKQTTYFTLVDADNGTAIAIMERFKDPVFTEWLEKEGVNDKTWEMYKAAAQITAYLNASLPLELSNQYNAFGPTDLHAKFANAARNIGEHYGINAEQAMKDMEELICDLPLALNLDSHPGNFSFSETAANRLILDPDDKNVGFTDLAKLLSFGNYLKPETQLEIIESEVVPIRENTKILAAHPGLVIGQQYSFIDAWLKSGKDYAIARIPSAANQAIAMAEFANLGSAHKEFFQRLISASP